MNNEVFKSYSYEQQKEQLEKYLKTIDPLQAHHGCSDGRKCVGVLKNGSDINDSRLTTQNFGGALGLASTLQLYNYLQQKPMLYETAIEQTLEALQANILEVGDHRDTNTHAPTHSGCDYADNRAAIIAYAATTQSLIEVVNEFFGEVVNNETKTLFDAVIAAYKQLNEHIMASPTMPNGSQLIELLEVYNGTTQILDGQHVEYAVIINRRASTTLNTNALVNDKGSAFNIDEYFVLYQQDKALKIPEQVAKMINYVDWASTLAVLTKDKPPLPVFIYE